MRVCHSLSTSSDDAKVGKASNGIGFNLDCLLWLRTYWPQDAEKIFATFPLARRVLLEHDYHKEKEEQTNCEE